MNWKLRHFVKLFVAVASNIYAKVAGVKTDLDLIFKARGGSTARANVGIKSNGNVDIAQRYYASTSSGDRVAAATGITWNDGGTERDLQVAFRDIAFSGGPTITDAPDDVTVDEGDSLSFSVSATASPGGGSLSYQWQKWNGSSWANVSGATSATLTINPCVRADQGDYRCQVTDTNGTTDSTDATGTVNYPPEISSGPTPNQTTFNEGDGMSIVVGATAGQPSGITYQWQMSTDGGGSWLNIDGSTHGGRFSGYSTNTLSITVNKDEDNSRYRCIVSNSAGSDTSSATVDMDVHYVPYIIIQPSDKDMNEGESDSSAMLCVAVGNTSPTYQWQKNISGTWTDLGGQTSTSLVRNSVALSNSGDYRCAVTNDRGTTYSDVKTLTVHENPGIVTQPTGGTYSDGVGPYQIGFCEADGDGTLSFEWFFDDGSGFVSLGVNTPGNLPGGVSDQVVKNPITFADAGDYYCRVTNSWGGTPVNSNTITVNVI